MWYSLLHAYTELMHFMDRGGPVLWLIAIALFGMWSAIFERVWYYRSGLRHDVRNVLDIWENRPERKSWNAIQIRRALISQVSLEINRNLPLIKTLVALCPLLGLLGTVTGMIEVFNILSITGGDDARLMAGGVSRATIPTMAGMVAALSGVFANSYLERIANRENQLIEDRLTSDY